MVRNVQAGVFLALLVAASCKELDYLQAVENPHIRDKKGSTVQGHIDVQPDTLMDIKIYKYMGVQVPIYFFKQPDRLNPDQLPFRIIRVSSIDMSSVVAIPHKMAHDSWFPAYYWDILVCGGCEGWRHIGWRFTPKGHAGEPFYALIVDFGEGKRRQADPTHPEGVLEALSVGVRAPAWLVALATATLQAQISTGTTTST